MPGPGSYAGNTLVVFRDERKVHFLTRGNVDGIISAALWLHHDPALRVSFVPSGDVAVDVMRKDIGSERFVLVDLGMTPRLNKTLHDKAKLPQDILYLDHHQQSLEQAGDLPGYVDATIRPGISAAGVVYEHLGLGPDHEHLVALADHVEFLDTERLRRMTDEGPEGRIEDEARILDFAWRHQVEDDRFRYYAACRLAKGRWPSQVSEVRARYLKMVNEGRWEKALDRVRGRMQIQHEVALLDFGRRKPSLFGFGARAVSEVARQEGAKVAALVNRRPEVSSISLRRTGRGALDLGRFVHDFTQHHGIVGGGHPHAAGAKIPTRQVRRFMHDIYCLA